jgi:hypothetical protein
METTEVILAELSPVYLMALSALMSRRLAPGFRLLLDLALLLASIPLTAWLVGRILDFPPDIGDHNPGVGVVFLPFALAWAPCVMVWTVRLVWFALRKIGLLHRYPE